MEPIFAIELRISRESGNLVAQIHNQLSNAILQGRLSSGTPLPSSRLLAAQLKISRNTVLQAYARLQSEGLLITLAGSGTVVADIVNILPHVATTANLLNRVNPLWQNAGFFAQPTGLPIEYDFPWALRTRVYFHLHFGGAA